MVKRGAWGTRFGFYLAAIGSACGLGNLWRFPYVVGENGGGAFVLLYVFFAMLIGLPILIAELMLGRTRRQSILAIMADLTNKTKKQYIWIARFAIGLNLVVLSYYAVISGWVLHFLMQSIVGTLSGQGLQSGTALEFLMKNGLLQVGLTSVHLLIAIVVVLKGVQDGLEKWIGYMMPLFAVLLFVLVFRSVSLPSGPEAMRFLFYPNFSGLSLNSMMNALGHVFFTLSVGFGTMVTFGSYLNENSHIPTAGVRVAFVDSFISLLAVMLIFPIVLEATNIKVSDPYLLFEALPRFLQQMYGGEIFGIAFFLCLYIAALGASIGLLEVIVSNVIDLRKTERRVAVWGTGIMALMIGILPALSSTVFQNIRFGNRGLLEVLDSVLINWILPLVAMGLSVAVYKALSEQERVKQFIDDNRIESRVLYPHWNFVLKWVVPGIVGLAFVLQIMSLF